MADDKDNNGPMGYVVSDATAILVCVSAVCGVCTMVTLPNKPFLRTYFRGELKYDCFQVGVHGLYTSMMPFYIRDSSIHGLYSWSEDRFPGTDPREFQGLYSGELQQTQGNTEGSRLLIKDISKGQEGGSGARRKQRWLRF